MERRRLVVVLAGLVLVGGGVAALRLVGGTPDLNATPPPPPIPTVIKPFHAPGVLVPAPGDAPAAPTHLTMTAGPHRLLATWSPSAGATGYEVRWGDNTQFVGEPDAEIDGLTPGQDTQVQVRAVDNFGQRSDAADGTAKPQADGPPGADNALVDHFDGAEVPDPRLWRLASPSNCAVANRGADRLVLVSECQRASATLRGRAPFKIDPSAPNGELGRFTIDTNAPGATGELDLDLVPGPADLIAGSNNDPLDASAPGTATIDDFLPPGTIRVRIGSDVEAGTNRADSGVEVSAGPGTPQVPVVARQWHALPTPRLGVSVRWDVVLRTDGIEVLRDGVLVASGNAVPGWTTATALVEFTGATQGQLQAGVSLIGFGGAPTSPPPLAIGPTAKLDTFVTVSPGASRRAITSTDTGPGSGLLLLTALVAPNTPSAGLLVNGAPPTFLVEVGSQVYTAMPAVPGEPLLPNVRYPLVARLPASLLHGAALTIGVTMDVPSTYPGEADVAQTDLEMVPGPDTRSNTTTSNAPAVVAVPPQLAQLSADVLDANGNPVPINQPLAKGRAVLRIQMDAIAAQRSASALAGLAGFEVWLDNNELVAVPTAMGGAGVGGAWLIAFDTGRITTGEHVIDVRAYGAQRGIAFTEAFASFALS